MCHIKRKLRNSKSYQKMRETLIDRDGVCVNCGSYKNIEVDHVKPFSLCTYQEKLDHNNCRALCHECHTKTPTYGIKTIHYNTASD